MEQTLSVHGSATKEGYEGEGLTCVMDLSNTRDWYSIGGLSCCYKYFVEYLFSWLMLPHVN